jgi:4-hydroxybenzoate polyprenyltransferase
MDKSSSTLWNWAQLVRIPNVWTILADVGAAFLLVAGGAAAWPRLIAILLSAVALYWAGMILNDWFDLAQDQRERPNRPLASGAISHALAGRVGWALLAFGVIAATVSGFVPANGTVVTMVPGIIAFALAICIILYDGPLKKTPVAPTLMGGCRTLSFLLGASPVVNLRSDAVWFSSDVMAFAIGFGTYIMGVTTIGRREAVGGRFSELLVGTVVTTAGIAILAIAPRFSAPGVHWYLSPERTFPILIGFIGGPVVASAFRLQRDPSPMNIQSTVRAGILSLIPLAAAVALLGAGRGWGLAICAMVVPALFMSVKFRVT